MRHKTLITCAAAAVCALSFLMPDAMLAVRDRALFSRVESVEADEVALNLLTELTDAQKLRLAGDSSAAGMPLKTGRNMDADAATKLSYEIMSRYFFVGDLFVGDLATSAEAQMKVGSDGSAIIVWQTRLVYDMWTLRLLLDDETGAVLGFAFSAGQEGGQATDPAPPGIGPSVDTDGEWGGPDMSIVMEVAQMFLAPFGLELEGTSVRGTDAVLLYISGGVTLPMTVRAEEQAYISINM